MPTILLICEDKQDAAIVRAILQKKSLEIGVKHVPMSGGGGGIARLSRELENLISQARKQRKAGDCIAVLHDADEHTQPDPRHHEQIRVICEKYKDDVYLAIARNAIEAWLLADQGLCRWLDIRVKNNDEDPQPKETLRSLLSRNKQMKWQGPDRAKVLAQLDGSGDQHSPSMRAAVSHINC